MFASDRDKQYAPFCITSGPTRTTTPRLFISDADGSNAVAVGPHSMAGTMHPYLLANGRIAETTKWMTHNLPYVYNNGSTDYRRPRAICGFCKMWISAGVIQRLGMGKI